MAASPIHGPSPIVRTRAPPHGRWDGPLGTVRVEESQVLAGARSGK